LYQLQARPYQAEGSRERDQAIAEREKCEDLKITGFLGFVFVKNSERKIF